MTDAKDYRFHPLAWRELEEADRWYFSHSYEVSLDFLSDLYAAVEDIARAPRRWPTHLHGTRRLVMQRFPFSIIYLDDPDLITIIAVAHSKRRPGYWEGRL
ncbi:MAG: type II toxin-antitoxin system RelE/ParE family toxin [Candidatus Sulfotelmatobacter sp.]|jgi:toxin ParE1/3/4